MQCLCESKVCMQYLLQAQNPTSNFAGSTMQCFLPVCVCVFVRLCVSDM